MIHDVTDCCPPLTSYAKYQWTGSCDWVSMTAETNGVISPATTCLFPIATDLFAVLNAALRAWMTSPGSDGMTSADVSRI